ncbi:MAG: hypothetical protein D6715_14410 [Calditrichaeota bacterium]|nr:MAG: hypothetical protein D6715_14410 [Calditrichota bacterium]
MQIHTAIVKLIYRFNFCDRNPSWKPKRWFAGQTVLMLSMVTLALFWLSCSRSPEQRQVLARVGNRTITWKYLQRSFHLDPKWGKGLSRAQAYWNQLNYLIDQKLFAQQAQAERLNNDPELAARLSFIRDKELIKALYRKEVASRVKISEADYQQAYLKSKRRVKFRYVATGNPERAQQYFRLMSQLPLDKEISPLDSSDEISLTDYMSFGDMDEAIEAFVFDLKPGETHAPVRVADRYYVVQLVDGQVEKFLSRMELAEKKNRLRKVIFDRRARKIAHRYVAHLMAGKKVHLNGPIFKSVAVALSRQIKEKFAEPPSFPPAVNNQEIKEVRVALSDLRDSTLVRYRDGVVRVGEFLQWLQSIPPLMRPPVSRPVQLKNALGILVRNKYLLQQALRQHLDRVDSVRQEIQWQQDALLARAWLKKQQETLQVTPAEIEQFRQGDRFAVVKARFGERLDDELLRNILLDYKLSQLKIRSARELARQYSVQVDSLSFRQHIKKPEQILDYDPIPVVVREYFF